MTKVGFPMQVISINKHNYKVNIEKSERKTIAIQLVAPYALKIKLPLQISNNEIKTILLKKAKWIYNKNQIILKNESIHINQNIEFDSLILFKGELIKISPYHNNSISTIFLDQNQLYINSKNKQEIAREIKAWYIKEALSYLNERNIFWCKKMNLKINRLTIKEQKTCWGSCSSKKNINYNWRIIMAPLSVIDYLIIHELSHLIHLNHSADFWDHVAFYCPNYKDERNWLKKNSYILSSLFSK